MFYLQHYINFLRKKLKPQKNLRVVFDCFNGTTGLVLKPLFQKNKKIKTVFLNDRPDGRFPAHGPNPLAPNALNQLVKKVLAVKADLGIAFDADGDRAFFVDNQGRTVPAYVAAYLLFLNQKPPFVAEIIAYESMKYAGIDKQVRPSRVGTYFVKQKMKKCRASVGAEYSGHYYFQDFFGADSGILAAVKIINSISQMPYQLADFTDLLPQRYETESFNLPASAKEKFMTMIAKIYQPLARQTNRIDGWTFEFDQGWFNIRPSNTEPLIRITWGKIINQ